MACYDDDAAADVITGTEDALLRYCSCLYRHRIRYMACYDDAAASANSSSRWCPYRHQEVWHVTAAAAAAATEPDVGLHQAAAASVESRAVGATTGSGRPDLTPQLKMLHPNPMVTSFYAANGAATGPV